jgi:8-oxo-dGTP diphosphatase
MTKPVTPLLTVDAVLFDAEDRLLVIRRKNPPFQGAWALPGGFVDLDESVEEACARELQEETGLVAPPLRLVGVYSKPGRDPRGATVTIAYAGRATSTAAVAGDDAAAVAWIQDWRTAAFAFDHFEIVQAAAALMFGDQAA